MRYQLLGRSGLRVSRLCLGTMTFGEAWGWGAGEAECRRIYDAFRDAGGNFIDTANIYTEGQSEEMLGRFLQGHRHEVVLATKYTNARPGRDSNAGGNHRKSMMRSIDESLRRLHTEFIDLYWMHIWDQMTPVDEVMRGFDDLVRQGKILHAGISDAPAWWVAQANTMADLRGWAPFVALQIEWSLIERSVERELVPMAQALGLTVTPWSPLAGGILTGKYRRGEGKGGRYEGVDLADFRDEGERVDRTVGTVLEIAGELACSPAQVALAWVLARTEVPVVPILGARSLAQLRDNLGALDVQLSADQQRRLDDASRVLPGFPSDFYRRKTVRALVYGGLRDSIDAPR